jgi:LPS sulfotransferase NodH
VCKFVGLLELWVAGGKWRLSVFSVYPDLQNLAAGLRRLEDDSGKLTIVVAMTARTGSNQFCAVLGASGGFLAPDEILNARSWVAHAAKERFGAETFEEMMAALRSAPGPCCGIKTNWLDFEPIAEFHDNLLPGARFIYLDRRDVLAQAVSLFRAVISDRWHVPVGTGLDAAQARTEWEQLNSRLDLAEILRTEKRLVEEKKSWERFFAHESISPVRVFYEDFVRDRRTELNRVGDALGVPLDQPVPADVGFERIGDALSEAWLEAARKHVLMMT